VGKVLIVQKNFKPQKRSKEKGGFSPFHKSYYTDQGVRKKGGRGRASLGKRIFLKKG